MAVTELGFSDRSGKSSPLSSESTSLSSSFVSSAVSVMLPADSSQSETDHSAAHLRLHDSPQHSPSAPNAMGQSFSKPSSPPDLPSFHKSISFSAAVAGSRLKRAFGARRKRSEDVQVSTSTAKRLDHRSSQSTSSTLLDQQQPPEVTPRPARGPKLTLQMATQVLTGGKKSTRTPSSPTPPPLPPKPANMQGFRLQPPQLAVPANQVVEQRSSIIALSPGISSAVHFMIGEQLLEEQERKNQSPAQKESESTGKVVSDQELDKRRSDSTISHHTIRPGATGTRTPRPVSVAESLQTICANNRRSVFEDGVPEENESFHSSKEDMPPEQDAPQPASSPSKNIRSLSLNVSQPHATQAADLKQPSKSLPDGHPPVSPASRDTPTLTRAAANGIIAPSSPSGIQTTGNNIRGRLAAWTAASNTTAMNPPPPSPQRLPPNPPPKSPATFRQTAMSMSAPAAGLAKRAVKKMGNWGGFTSSSSANASGYSSSSSSTAPSSYDNKLKRTASSTSKKLRRTPDAPSGTWSVHSSTSVGSSSDSEAIIAPSGPSLGLMVRAPLVRKSAGAAGIVFGRDLKTVARLTAIGVGESNFFGEGRHMERKANDPAILQSLEGRVLPALIARCAQHLLIWGIQEEGLFRVNGRPAHVAKLRNEFDTGADFDMRECSPGELDPHAVASVFKAFLRELPEPILTRTLVPRFEEALSKANITRPEESSNVSTPMKLIMKGPGLPSNPKSGFASLRKPPSLSTLAMPSFHGIPPPSQDLINSLQSLISQLPSENRDLLKTVTQLIKITASQHKQTKMPLSNLLLVFCPSLNMNPPLLKILCEADGIWALSTSENVIDPNAVINIKRESVVLDIRAPPSIESNDDSGVEASEDDEPYESEKYSDARDGTEEELDESLSVQGSPRTESESEKTPLGLDVATIESSKSTASSRSRLPRARPMGPRRQAVPATVFADSEALLSSPSSHIESELTSDGSTEGVTSSFAHVGFHPPPLSSSAESLSTPSSSSGEPSFEHLSVKKKEDYDNIERSSSPMIADPSEYSLPATLRKSFIGGSIQFPGSGSLPPTPLSGRRSAPLLSLPSPFKSSLPSTSTSSAPASPRIRLKRPSMNLFPKRSTSALTGSSKPIISSPYLIHHAASESSISTPLSAVTAPQSSSSAYVIDTPVDSSPLIPGLDLEIEVGSASSSPKVHPSHSNVSLPISYYPGTTPIADRFRCESATSSRSLQLQVNRQTSQASFLSVASSNQLDLANDEAPDEWTRSVLLAADVDWDSSST